MTLFIREPRPVPCPIDCEHEYNHVRYGRLWYNIKMRAVHRDIRHERLMVAFTGKVEVPSGQAAEQRYVRVDNWTRYKPKQLENMGFRRAEGVPGYDSIVFWGVPIYVKIQEMRSADIPSDSDRVAEDTAATLHDCLKSRATENFMKGMAKTALPSIDLQKMAMFGILAVGAIFGCYLLGVF